MIKLSKGRLIKICLFAFFGGALIFFLFPMLCGIVHTGTVVGTALFLAAIAVTLLSEKVAVAISFIWRTKPLRIIAVILSAIVWIGIIFVFFISSNIIRYACFDKADGSETAMVVLGCKVNGTAPSLMLRERIEAAYDYHLLHPDMTIIASGGKGADEGISEAQCIRDELVKKGVPSSLILMEDKSTSTYENLKFSLLSLYATNSEPAIAIATDGFHQYRTRLIAQDLDEEAIDSTGYQITIRSVSADTPWYLLPSYFLREIFAVAERIVFE